MVIACSINKNPVSWGDSFDVSVSFRLDANEAIAAARGGWAKISLIPNNGDGSAGKFNIVTSENVSLSAGRIYTFTFSGNALKKTDVDPGSGLTYDEIFQQSADVGSDRIFPLAVEVRVGETITGREYAAQQDGVSDFLYERIAPVISNVRFTDKNPINPYEKYGGYVLGGQSVPEIAGVVQLDPLDPNLTATHKIEITTVIDPGGTNTTRELIASVEGKYPDTLALVLPEHIQYDLSSGNGLCEYHYTITDSAGNSSSEMGYIFLYDYNLPVLTGVTGLATVERYVEKVSDDGTVSYPASEDGEQLRVSYALDVSAIGFTIRNNWTMDVRYGIDGAEGYTDITAARDGSDLDSGECAQDRTLLEGIVFPASSRWYVTLTVTDDLGNSVQLTGYIDKAGGYANIEKHGAAIGMRTTATADHKKFEVARGYESIFYGGIRGVNILTSEEVDTGGKWLNGKTIYAKTLVYKGAAGNTAYEIALPEGVEQVWLDAANSFHDNYNGVCYSPNAVVGGTAVFLLILSTTSAAFKTSLATGGDFYIRVFYTKAGDAAEDLSSVALYDSEGLLVQDVNGRAVVLNITYTSRYTGGEIDAGIEKAFAMEGLPGVNAADNGKVLTVVDGAWIAADLPKYDGEYSVTPAVEEQTLLTSQKYLDANLKIEKIPYSEVTNTANGTTATIG